MTSRILLLPLLVFSLSLPVSSFLGPRPFLKPTLTGSTSKLHSLLDPSTLTSLSDLSAHDFITSLPHLTLSSPPPPPTSIEFKDTEITSYSKNSYYAILGLYTLSFPGLWSTIKRSTKAKTKRKTFTTPGELASGRSLRQVAGEIMAYFKANNYEVSSAGETIKFKGLVAKSTSQAFFLTFCTALCLASLALVLQIQFIDVQMPVIGGNINWFYICLLSPYAGVYYWKGGDREDEFECKLVESDDQMEVEVNVLGDEEEIERMWRKLELQEKGMVKIEGLLDSA
ncbi:hypothetical protein TrST_g11619 [Triparma strigata]|uniref:Uncharacterized protein n=1 Tax=Triparma strigata TaxID=1606541 RepID=A0A9W7BGP9_9STRA|nr:hypothetical protein TrST_g11619 [Triparma strigata]